MKNLLHLGFLLLFPFIGLAQGYPKKITALENKVELMVPNELNPMPDRVWQLKFPNQLKAPLALSNDIGAVSLIATPTKEVVQENQMAAITNSRFELMREIWPSAQFLDHGVLTVNGRKIGYLKFIHDAMDIKVFNYYFLVPIEGRVVLFSFACIQPLQKTWEPAAEQIVHSLKIR